MMIDKVNNPQEVRHLSEKRINRPISFKEPQKGRVDLQPIAKLRKDIRHASHHLSKTEARFLVDYYYQMQENRKRMASQLRSLLEAEEPHEAIAWFLTNTESLEGQIKRALLAYAEANTVGKWALSLVGIGPVITAGLLAHINIEKAPTVGHIWSFAGLNPTVKWQKGQKRPWNASLKRLCWIIGDSFNRFSGRDECFYGKLLLQRKREEWERNIRGELSAEACRALESNNFNRAKDSYAWYSGRLKPPTGFEYTFQKSDELVKSFERVREGEGVPMLSPAHIQQRSARYAVKLFLAHFHEKSYVERYGMMPPKPYVLEHLGHAHKIDPP